MDLAVEHKKKLEAITVKAKGLQHEINEPQSSLLHYEGIESTRLVGRMKSAECVALRHRTLQCSASR